MDADALKRWKSQIFNYQQHVRKIQPTKQIPLFDLSPTYCDPDLIDPFSLRLHSIHFWEYPADSPGDACLYFVIDNSLPLLLYVGETCRSYQRWKGEHDCKHYLGKYHDLHYRYNIERAVNIAFWWDAPMSRQPRQELELSLIHKWKPPFNKENWQRWGQPFGK